MRKTIIAVVASLALGTATMATSIMAFAHGGGGHFGGGGGHFSGGGHFGGGSHFAGGRFGRGFGDGFGGVYGVGGGPYYGFGYNRCYLPTPSGYAWVCY
jgi:hypothetical protein